MESKENIKQCPWHNVHTQALKKPHPKQPKAKSIMTNRTSSNDPVFNGYVFPILIETTITKTTNNLKRSSFQAIIKLWNTETRKYLQILTLSKTSNYSHFSMNLLQFWQKFTLQKHARLPDGKNKSITELNLFLWIKTSLPIFHRQTETRQHPPNFDLIKTEIISLLFPKYYVPIFLIFLILRISYSYYYEVIARFIIQRIMFPV
jgi:hypothetical protein